MPIAAALRDRLVAADPGLTRFYMALRAAAGVGMAFLILQALSRAFHLPLTVPLLGAAIGMTWSISINDPGRRQQRVTTLALWIPAATGLVLGTATAGNRVVGDLVFLAVLFASVYVRRYGPRGFSAGMVAVLSFFFALFLRATFAQLPWLLLALVITMLCTYVLRFFVFPDRPERALTNGVSAFRARGRLIARLIERAAARGGWTPSMQRAVNHNLFRLNETALALDDILRDTGEPAARAAVLDAELQTAEQVENALRDPRAPLVLPELDLSPERIQARNWTPRGPFRAGTAIDTGFLSPSVRQALQITVAAAVSIVAGELLSPQRWYWAVLTAFLVFSGTSSAGETLNKAWSRFVGTALGVLAAIGTGTLVRGDRTAALLLLFVFLFAAVYTLRLSYAVMIFFFTAVLSMLYLLIGAFSDRVMLLRLLETAIGAACGGLAAFLIFPIRTRDVVGNVAAEALQRLEEAVDRSVDRLSGNSQADPIAAVRAYDEALQAVRLQLLPLIAPARIARNEGMLTRLHLFAACGFYARALAALAYESPGECPPDALERERTKIEGDIQQAIEILEGRAKTFTEAGPPAQTSGGEVLTYLERIDRAVRRLGKNLAASG